MNIGILGTPVTSGNRGVQALATSLLNLCLLDNDNAIVKLFLNTRNSTPAQFTINGSIKDVPIINCRLSLKSKFTDHLFAIVLASLLYNALHIDFVRRYLRSKFQWINAVLQTDFIGDIRGGDSFSDIYGMRRYLVGFLIAWTVVLLKGSIIQFPQTLGPYESKLSKLLARYLLKRSSIIYARDKTSTQLVNHLIGNNRSTHFCPDVAFTLPATKPKSVVFRPTEIDEISHSGSPTGININALVLNGGYNRHNMFDLSLNYPKLLLDIIQYLQSTISTEIWLISHTFADPGDIENDPDACQQLYNMIPQKNRQRLRILEGKYGCSEVKWLIGQCEFFIGSRMHSCIAALSQGVPCIGIGYSRKFIGVFETVSMPDCVIDATKQTNDQALDHFKRLYATKDNIKLSLSTHSQNACEKVMDVFSHLFNANPKSDRFDT